MKPVPVGVKSKENCLKYSPISPHTNLNTRIDEPQRNNSLLSSSSVTDTKNVLSLVNTNIDISDLKKRKMQTTIKNLFA